MGHAGLMRAPLKRAWRLPALMPVLALVLAACSPSASDAAAPAGSTASAVGDIHPESGLPIVSLAVRGDGRVHAFRVEVARTRVEQAKGLMFRTTLGADAGMLFPLDPPREASFWMKNTVIPLDIIFIGPDRRILNIAANTTPYSEEPLLSDGTAIAVLELAGGSAARLGIRPGDKVDW